MQDLLELAESDPRRCVEVASQVIGSDSEEVEKAAAFRAQGIALRDLGRIDESAAALENARTVYSSLGMDFESDECVVSLAASVALSGQFKRAIAMLDPLCERSDTTIRSHALVQRAGLVARSGGFEESLAMYGEAEPLLAANNDQRWLALMFSTRGLVQTYRSHFDEAESDLKSAMEIFEAMGRDSSAAVMLGNLGFLYVVRGDIAHGLDVLLDAKNDYETWGMPTDPVETAQAFGYMLAGMPRRAHEVLEAAANHLGAQGREILQAEALIQAGRAAMAANDVEAALSFISSAQQLPSLADREGWSAIADLVRADAMVSSTGVSDTEALIDLHHRFLGWKNLTGAAHAVALAASVDLDTGEQGSALERLELLSEIDEALVELPVRVFIGLVRARISIAANERIQALNHLRETADRIDAQRILLGATESRAGLSILSDRIAELGLQLMADGREAVEWIDRFRASSLRMVPVIPNPDPEVARTMGELRRRAKERDEALAAGEDASDQSKTIRELELRIRDIALARPEVAGPASALGIDEIRSALGARRLLYLYDRGGTLIGALLDSDGERVEALGQTKGLISTAHHLSSAMRRSFMYPDRAVPERVHSTLKELGQRLVEPFSVSDGEMVVVPPPDMISLPWNALAGAVASELEVVVAPSADAWTRAHRLERRVGKVSVVAGPRLAQSTSEAMAVANVYGNGVDVLDGDRSTVEEALGAIQSSVTFHAVAHGRLRKDNPMFSAVELGDGDLNLYLLEGLAQVPSTVILSACDSAHGNVVGGLEMFGLSSVLLSRGSRSVLSTIAPIPDSPASISAVERIHQRLRHGDGPAKALHAAQASSASSEVDPSLAFVAYGAG